MFCAVTDRIDVLMSLALSLSEAWLGRSELPEGRANGSRKPGEQMLEQGALGDGGTCGEFSGTEDG